MRIHTSLHRDQLLTVLRNSGAAIDTEAFGVYGSRTHDSAWEVRLTGSGGRNNTGLYGAGDYNGATWDEWGAFFGALFELDPEARCGGTEANPVYRDARHYHYLTGDRFQARAESVDGLPKRWNHLPADTHPRHRWEPDNPRDYRGGFHCAKAECSAVRPPFIAGRDWS